MTLFLNHLNREIANVAKLYHYMELEDMIHVVMKVERQLKRKGQLDIHRVLTFLEIGVG